MMLLKWNLFTRLLTQLLLLLTLEVMPRVQAVDEPSAAKPTSDRSMLILNS